MADCYQSEWAENAATMRVKLISSISFVLIYTFTKRMPTIFIMIFFIMDNSLKHVLWIGESDVPYVHVVKAI